jgi:hypothetical protein
MFLDCARRHRKYYRILISITLYIAYIVQKIYFHNINDELFRFFSKLNINFQLSKTLSLPWPSNIVFRVWRLVGSGPSQATNMSSDCGAGRAHHFHNRKLCPIHLSSPLIHASELSFFTLSGSVTSWHQGNWRRLRVWR